MGKGKSVILVGWNPDVVDYSKWPGLTPEKLRSALEKDRNTLIELGYDAVLGLIDSDATAHDALVRMLGEKPYDCVLIGAGVRTVAEHFRLFETLVNTAHQHAPQAKICFNTGPTDSVEAVQRWV